jgi:hypothetical protein
MHAMEYGVVWSIMKFHGLCARAQEPPGLGTLHLTRIVPFFQTPSLMLCAAMLLLGAVCKLERLPPICRLQDLLQPPHVYPRVLR